MDGGKRGRLWVRLEGREDLCLCLSLSLSMPLRLKVALNWCAVPLDMLTSLIGLREWLMLVVLLRLLLLWRSWLLLLLL